MTIYIIEIWDPYYSCFRPRTLLDSYFKEEQAILRAAELQVLCPNNKYRVSEYIRREDGNL